jgi:hypothetical protein
MGKTTTIASSAMSASAIVRINGIAVRSPAELPISAQGTGGSCHDAAEWAQEGHDDQELRCRGSRNP